MERIRERERRRRRKFIDTPELLLLRGHGALLLGLERVSESVHLGERCVVHAERLPHRRGESPPRNLEAALLGALQSLVRVDERLDNLVRAAADVVALQVSPGALAEEVGVRAEVAEQRRLFRAIHLVIKLSRLEVQERDEEAQVTLGDARVVDGGR